MKNTTHPGLPFYTGPTEGNFTFLHHKGAIEESADVDERIDFILRSKPAEELDVRLASIMYVPPGSPVAEAWNVCKAARAGALKVCDAACGGAWKVCDAARAETWAHFAPILATVMPLNWNGKEDILL